MTFYPELGFYALPGFVREPTPIFDELADAERLGLGSVWISERLNSKDIGVLTGAAIARTQAMGIASGLINNLPLRNPVVVASYAATSMMLSGNRFTLGIGRGTKSLVPRLGIPHATDQYVEDYVDILRRLWRGETVSYEGPVGKLEGASLGMALDVLPPVFLGAAGFKNAEWAGSFCDGVLFNTFWSKAATQEGIARFRAGAERAGRDPDANKVWAILATACEVPEEVELRTIIRRLNTYLFFPAEWNATMRINGWDPDVAERLKIALKTFDGDSAGGSIGDENTTRNMDDLRRMRDLWPREWIDEATATGDATHCARCVLDRFDAGVDGVAFHATAPGDVGPLLTAWDAIRPADRFAGRTGNPGI